MIDKKESIRRLTVLRDFLKDNVNEENFKMNMWECGTTKCALGWACHIPEFNALGLKSKSGDYIRPEFFSCSGFTAGSKFFGITMNQSEYMFSPDHYKGVPDRWSVNEVLPITMQDVLSHIDDVIMEQAA